MGFTEESLQTDHSEEIWRAWKEDNQCQPNFWLVSAIYIYTDFTTMDGSAQPFLSELKNVLMSNDSPIEELAEKASGK